ncbi:transglycosylase domain-containing protein [Robertkochia solimangrovi]|uniref:transglycosylase domain-containing protein n=1 Tax=Robertkochia solimangrovi TaxID=2213046 RepID=UPI00117CCAD8|nr:transglycosylase domain-containing protein [Robertkochia solimangrovi]TRZ45254.1 penicillin-binding protein [Robertkochia solimangrovi]
MLKRLFKKYWKILAIITGSLFFLVVALFISIYAGMWGKLPSEEELKHIRLDQATEILDVNGELIGKLFINDRQPVQMDQIPESITNALISTEDVRFYEHDGVDNRSLMRVLFKSILMGDESSGGGSTITQQLAKNLFPRQNLGKAGIVIHKIKESIIAKRLEKVYSKDEILLNYLNTVPFGDNTFGVESAAKHFFNKPVSKLDIPEAATLVGMLKATYTYNPRINPEKSIERRNVVMSQMVKYDRLAEDSLEILKKDSLGLDLRNYSYDEGIAPYFREQIRKDLQKWAKQYEEENDTVFNIYTGGFKVITTLNYDMQVLAEDAMQIHMEKLQEQFEKSYGKNAPWSESSTLMKSVVLQNPMYKKLIKDGLSEKEALDSLKVKHQVSLFNWNKNKEIQYSTIDSIANYLKMLNCGSASVDPHTGAIRTWIGGINYKSRKYDHVSQSKRQVGSTFKPFVYTTALEQGINPCTYYAVRAVEYENMEGWTPSNASDKEDEEYMNYSMQYALSHSINTIAVKVLEDAGITNVIEQAEKMGITSTLPEVPSLALGTAELGLLEVAKAYTTYVNDGAPATPYYLERIEDESGKVLWQKEKSENAAKVLSDMNREIMLEMLKSTIDEGTATRIRNTYGLKNDIAGKTGTTQLNKDGWFVGITPELVSVSWVGLDDHRIGFKNTAIGQGANSALPLFALWYQKLNDSTEFDAITSAKFPEPSEEVLEAMACDTEKRDGFFKRLFSNPEKTKKRNFKTNKRGE